MDKKIEAKEIKKSINITIDETKIKLMQVLVQAQLPTSIAEMIIKEVAANVSIQAQQTLQKEKTQYQEKLQEAAKKVGEDNVDKERTGK